jgi:endonuclease III
MHDDEQRPAGNVPSDHAVTSDRRPEGDRPADGPAMTRHDRHARAQTASVRPATLPSLVNTLRRYYGKPTPPISTDPFQLILWEQVAYLVPDPRRRSAYLALRARVGVTPAAIMAAPMAKLRAIARLGGGIAVAVRAARLRRSSEIVLERWRGNLRTALRRPLAEARRALARFPMIGEPGADKILVQTRTARLLPLDSNALRVVQRLGLAPEADGYRTAYRKAQAALAPQLPAGYPWLIAAGQLLRQHGQEICRRSAPDCRGCPLRNDCAFGRSR